VFRVAAGYVVLVWALLQVADVLIPALGLGDSHLRALVWVAALLLPLLIFLSWRYCGKKSVRATFRRIIRPLTELSWSGPIE